MVSVPYFSVCPGRSWQTDAMYESLGCFLGRGGKKGIYPQKNMKSDITIVFVFIWMRIERYSVIFSVLCALYLHFVMFFATALCPYWWSQGPPSTAPTHWPDPQIRVMAAQLVASNKTQFNTLMLLSEHLIWGMAWISNANNNAIKMIEKMDVMYRYLSLFQQRLSNDTMETCSEVRVCISSTVWKTSNHGLQIQCRGHGTKGTNKYPSWNIVLFYCNLCIVLTRFSSSWICPEMVAGAALLPEDSNSISNVFPKNWGLVCLGPALVSNQSFEISKELSFAFSWQCHRVLLLSNVECMKNT